MTEDALYASAALQREARGMPKTHLIDNCLDSVEHGRFREALDCLEGVFQNRAPSLPQDEVLLCEVLEACGIDDRAVDLGTALLDRIHASSDLKARLLAALARIHHRRGQVRLADKAFADALRLAEKSNDIRLTCAIQLSALGTVADTWPRAILPGFIADIRRRVIQLGDRLLLARLHQYVARFESMDGRLAAATRHLAAGRCLFEPENNVSLAGRFAMTEAAVCVFGSEFGRALHRAKDAVRHFQVSGERWNEHAAKTTEGFVALFLGRFDRAADVAKEILATDSTLPIRMAALDTLAEVMLAHSRLQDANDYVAEMQLLVTQDTNPSYLDLNVRESMIRLSGRQEDWRKAEAVAREAVSQAETRREALAAVKFRLYHIEALTRQGRTKEAERAAVEVLCSVGRLPSGLSAQLERVLGLLFEAKGIHGRALKHLGRAFRINSVAGNMWGNTDTAADYAAIAAANPFPEPVPMLVATGGASQDPWQLLASSLSTPISGQRGSEETVERTARMLGLGGRAELMAAECVEALLEAGCTDGITVVSRGADGDLHVHAAIGLRTQDAQGLAQASESEGTVTIAVGENEGRKYSVILRSADDLVSSCTIVALKNIVEAALALEAYRRDEQQRASLWPVEDDPPPDDEVYHSHDMRQTLTVARRIAPTALPVLITGETGTGKEVLARTIHRASPNASKPFLAFNCSAVPRDMIESQLFGYRRGAFTGASESFPGVIRAAAGGTLFLDEIGDLGLDIQPKLLRFLDTKEIHPLGQPQPITVDVRVIAATNADLDQLVSEGRFREDLFYRLQGGLIFKLPPLRRRREEIPALVQQFVRRSADELSKGRPRVSEEALEYLLLYRWPGNVRQLANEIRRVVALVEPDAIITPDHLSPDIRASRRTIPADQPARDGEMTVQTDGPLAAAIEAVERRMVARALERNQGRLEAAARDLGISRKGLFLKRRRLGLDPSSPSR